MAEEAKQTFLPWVQPGVAADFPDHAVERLREDQASVLSLTLHFLVNTTSLDKTARLYGPGDVGGIDPQQVVRLEPKRGTTDFEPNYFPAIEFDRPDFPWLFTPAKADAEGKLRPWLCLVVVRKQAGVELRQRTGKDLPQLEIKDPAKPGEELPDLSESHFWAHAQVTGVARDKIKGSLDSDPARSVSRLLCPRRLDPLTDYIACVVPAFAVGRDAGLNKKPDTDKLLPAWRSGPEAPDEITLPVYYFWEFRTAAGGDFEDLVRRLKRRDLPDRVGQRQMDISQPGFKMSPELPAGTNLALEGALRVLRRKPPPSQNTVPLTFQTALAEILNTPWELATKDAGDAVPTVGPPLYGCWQAAAHQVGKSHPTTPPWLNELNLDPRHRATAAMGTQVVQQQQEQLMASAWEQLGDIQKINQRLRQAQLSRAVNEKYYAKIFHNLSEEVFFKVVAPAQSRVVLPPVLDQPGKLLAQKLTESKVPSTAVWAPLRKMSRPRGTINRKFEQAGAPGVQTLIKFFNSGSAGSLTTNPANRTRGAITIDSLSDFVSAMLESGQLIAELPPVNVNTPQKVAQVKEQFRTTLAVLRSSNINPETIRSKPAPTPQHLQFAEAAALHQEHLGRIFTTVIAIRTPNLFPMKELKATVLTSLDPARTISDAVTKGARLKSPNPLTNDELDPIMDAPEFPQPMYEALRDFSQELLFPGLESVPADTVQLLETNSQFIESFMVGLNAEMSRELLWRDYPTDQRGTYFRQFWDTAAAGAKAEFDIPPIHQWKNNQLGSTAGGPRGDKVVLLIRGELLRRYPGTAIYAAKAILHKGRRVPAVDHPTVAASQGMQPPFDAYPVFRGTLEPDVTFVGFNLTRKEVIDGQGWFFVLQQQPTEPRFGLDLFAVKASEDEQITMPKTWNDLSWEHLMMGGTGEKLTHVPVNKVQLTAQTDQGTWGRNSAHMAYITKQLPSRIAIHAGQFISREPAEDE